MDDLISRQAAIELWEEYHPYIAVKACEYGKRLRSLPSAERRGRWILPNKEKTDRPMAECSICGWYVTEGERLDFTYCPNCGADMRGENNGQLAEG